MARAEGRVLIPLIDIEDVAGSTRARVQQLKFPTNSLDTGWDLSGNTTFFSFIATRAVTVSAGAPISGSTNYIQNTTTLQSGATFFVSSGSISGSLDVS